MFKMGKAEAGGYLNGLQLQTKKRYFPQIGTKTSPSDNLLVLSSNIEGARAGIHSTRNEI